jgi:hypothetical protein
MPAGHYRWALVSARQEGGPDGAPTRWFGTCTDIHEPILVSEELAQTKMMVNTTSNSWLSFRDYDGKVLLYFTTLMSYRPVLKEVRYSLNSDALDRTFKFKPANKKFEVGDDVCITVPGNTEFATAQVTFKDGTTSSMQKFVRSK